jgi:hypothetical protein
MTKLVLCPVGISAGSDSLFMLGIKVARPQNNPTSKFKDANGGRVFEADNVGIFKIEGNERKCC